MHLKLNDIVSLNQRETKVKVGVIPIGGAAIQILLVFNVILQTYLGNFAKNRLRNMTKKVTFKIRIENANISWQAVDIGFGK